MAVLTFGTAGIATVNLTSYSKFASYGSKCFHKCPLLGPRHPRLALSIYG
jgi:hypothetical protein